MNVNHFKFKIEQISSKKPHLILLTFAFSLITFFLLPGCDQTFNPIQENSSAPFSMFGYLDASADTQWVRITPVRGQIDLLTEIPEMTVTVEDIKTGRSDQFRDSLFTFPDGLQILNAWSTTKILKPGGTYRVETERADGAESHVTITFPADFPTPRLEINYDFYQAILFIEDVENLLTVQVRTLAHITSESAGWNYTDVFWTPQEKIIKMTENDYKVLMTPSSMYNVRDQLPDPPNDDLDIEYLHHQVFVASAGPEWRNDLDELSDIQYSLPEILSNVKNGTGYIFGIVSKSVPFKSCFNEKKEYITCPAEAPLH